MVIEGFGNDMPASRFAWWGIVFFDVIGLIAVGRGECFCILPIISEKNGCIASGLPSTGAVYVVGSDG